MSTFPDFVEWAKPRSNAAALLGMSESQLSLLLNGKRNLLPEHVIRAEKASSGLFRCEEMLPSVEFVRDDAGEVVGHVVPLVA
jgi:DNA-binding transcriptional regulator YdaS (Cro superfamily)